MSSNPPDSGPRAIGFTCGLDATLRLVAAKWKLLILHFLAQNDLTRYVELRRAVRDCSDTMMSQKLKELEVDDLIRRVASEENPSRVDYGLTPMGRSLAEALLPLSAWGTDNGAEISRILARREGATSKDC